MVYVKYQLGAVGGVGISFLFYTYVKWKFSVVMALDSRICDVFYDSSQWFDGRIRQGQSEAQILLVSPKFVRQNCMNGSVSIWVDG